MNIQYHSLFKLQLRHGYFSDGKVRDVAIVPTAHARHLMNVHDLRMVERDSGIEVFYGSREHRQALMSQLEEDVRLSFTIRPQDPRFYNFTDLPLEEVEERLYLFDVGDLAGSDPITRITAGDAPRISLHPSSATGPAADEGIEDLTPLSGRIIGEGGLQAGDYGVLSLIIPAETTEETLQGLPDISLTLPNRSTYWRYHLIAEDAGNFRFEGKMDGEPVAFTSTTAPGAAPEHTRSFVSDRALPLRHRYNDYLTLYFTPQDSPAEMNLRLPNASADRIGGTSSNDPENAAPTIAYSDIFVYL